MSGAVVGIDPGLTGAIAYVTASTLVVVDMPVCDGDVDPYELTQTIINLGPVDVVALEAVHSMPRQGLASTFRFGKGYGTIIGVLAALERPVVRVAPTTWTKAMRVGPDKDAHRMRCKELWPAGADLFSRKKDDGRADAALIAWWAMHLREGRAA